MRWLVEWAKWLERPRPRRYPRSGVGWGLWGVAGFYEFGILIGLTLHARTGGRGRRRDPARGGNAAVPAIRAAIRRGAGAGSRSSRSSRTRSAGSWHDSRGAGVLAVRGLGDVPAHTLGQLGAGMTDTYFRTTSCIECGAMLLVSNAAVDAHYPNRPFFEVCARAAPARGSASSAARVRAAVRPRPTTPGTGHRTLAPTGAGPLPEDVAMRSHRVQGRCGHLIPHMTLGMISGPRWNQL